MKNRKRFNKVLTTLILAAFCFTTFASPAVASEVENERSHSEIVNKAHKAAKTERENERDEEKPTPKPKSNSNMISVTERYVNGSGGKELINTKHYDEPYDDAVKPQEIDGYRYVTYEKELTNVYLGRDIPYIVGYPDKTVRPLRYISRAEAAVIFHRLFDGEFPKQVRTWSQDTFKDIKHSNWHYESVKKMYECGMVDGVSKNAFKPNKPITRAELAALAARFNPEKFSNNDNGSFKDVSTGKWYSDVVALTAANEWFGGYPDGTFKPNNYITRAETMAVINRVLDREMTVEKLRELNVTNPYKDIDESHWAYADALEATIDHRNEHGKWHGFDYNDGKYNVIIERYEDVDGNVIAEEISSDGKEVPSPKDIAGFKYVGYVKVLTYVYEQGFAKPTLTKTSNGEGDEAVSILPDGEVLYTLVASNEDGAKDRIRGAYIEDELPEYLSLVEGSVKVDDKASAYQLTKGESGREILRVNIPDVLRGESYTITFKALVDRKAVDKEIKNEAILNGTNIDPVKAEDKGYIVDKSVAFLEIDKRASVSEAKVGDEFEYGIKVTNDKVSKVNALEVVLTDELEEGLDFLGNVKIDNKNANTSDWNFDKETRMLTVELGDMEPREKRDVTFDVRINDKSYGRTLENIGIAKAKNGDPVESDAETALVEVAPAKAYLDIEKEADKSRVQVGEEFNYTIKVGNNRDSQSDALNVILTDELEKELDFKDIVKIDGRTTHDYIYDEKTHTLKVELGDIAPEKEKTVTFRVAANEKGQGKTILNLAVAKGENTDPAEVTEKVAPKVVVDPGVAYLDIQKQVDKTEVKVGDKVRYDITVKNDPGSKVKAQNVTVEDALNEAYDFNAVRVDNKSADYTLDPKTQLLTVNLGDMEPGAKKKVTVEVTVNEKGYDKKLPNIATAKADNGDPVQDDATLVRVEQGTAELDIKKVADKKLVKVGDTLIYTLNIANVKNAEVAAENVTITDILPEEVSFSGTAIYDNMNVNYDYDVDTNKLVLYLGRMEIGQESTVKIHTVVKPDAYGKSFLNAATIDADNATPKTDETNERTEVEPGSPNGSLSTKVPSKTFVKPGERISYTLTLKNSPQATADWDITVTDPIPEGMTFADAVELNGKATNAYSYDAESETLTLKPDPIAPGESTQYKIDVTIDEGTEGKFITNIAELTDNETGDKEPVPSVPVEVDKGKPAPSIKKTANVEKTKEGDVYEYTVVVENQDSATATWKNVYVRDTLPDTVDLYGLVAIDGNSVHTNHVDGVVMVEVGDLAPGEKATLTYKVQVKEGAAWKDKKREIVNVVEASGDNDVGFPVKDEHTVPLDPKGDDSVTPNLPVDGDVHIKKDTEKTLVDLQEDPRNKYTLTLTNRDTKAWEKVKIYDEINNNYFIIDVATFKKDGEPMAFRKDFHYKGENTNGIHMLIIEAGTIQPGEQVVIEFEGVFTNSTRGKEMKNIAVAKSSSHGEKEGTAPIVTTINKTKIYGPHQKLMSGYADGRWIPQYTDEGHFVTVHEASAVILRAWSELEPEKYSNAMAAVGHLDKPEGYYGPEPYVKTINVLIKDNMITKPEYTPGSNNYESWQGTSTKRLIATREMIGRWASKYLGADARARAEVAGYSYTDTTPSNFTKREDFAKEILIMLNRDTNPDTNNLPVHKWKDVPGHSGVVDEISNSHGYILDGDKEIWVWTDPNFKPIWQGN